MLPFHLFRVGGSAPHINPAHQLADVCRARSLARAVQSPAFGQPSAADPSCRSVPNTALFDETDLGLELDRLKGAKIGPERPKVSFSGQPDSQIGPKWLPESIQNATS